MREIVGSQLQAESRDDEVKVERGVAESLENLAEILERSGFRS